MTVAWDAGAAGAALAGGLMIGVAAAALLVATGRIAGVSGIVGGLLSGPSGERGWRAAFVGGLLAGGLVLALVRPAMLPSAAAASPPVLVFAGLLVGVGTRLGSGCTSGHGVCGVSRGSPRSIVATGTFMAAGMATVFVVRHLLGGVP